jgi:hypothetical protein
LGNFSPNNSLESGSAPVKPGISKRKLNELRKNFMDVIEDEREAFSR